MSKEPPMSIGELLHQDKVQLQAGHGGVDGYRGFHAAFIFDAEGKFVSAGIWE